MKKQQADVVVDKIHNENKSPQDPQPPTPSASFAKSVDDLKKILGVGADTALTSSNSGDTNNAGGGGGAPSGTADNAQSEKEKMQQKLKEVS
eukprot:scaffold40228_cov67-Skeletonema_dohrnii-CCMP3373.AAC.1